jgi:hypothetical protein
VVDDDDGDDGDDGESMIGSGGDDESGIHVSESSKVTCLLNKLPL